MKKEILNKPNQLIATISYQNELTLLQKKAYNILLKHAQKEVKFTNNYDEIKKTEDLYHFKIDANLLHEAAGLKRNDYKYIEKELEALMGVVLTIRKRDDKYSWEKITILPRIEKLKNENKYSYSLFGHIVEALKNQNFFTTLNLLIIKTLQSKYSVILYELAIRYQKYKIPKMSIEEFREITHTQNEYKRIFDLKKYVLDTACKEINEKTDIRISYKTEKIGRRIAYIEFEIKKKNNEKKIDIKTNDWNAAKKYFDNLPENRKNKIKNPGAYIKKLAEKHALNGYIDINLFEEEKQREKEEISKEQAKLLQQADVNLKGLLKKI